MPLFSIITVVYNAANTLENTIQSVLNQSYSDKEYIIIDGGSTDGTVDIIKKYENQLSYWVSEKDNGISDAFNKGIKHANGDVIGILNADDWYEVDTLSIIAKYSTYADVLHGKVQYWRNGSLDYFAEGNHNFLYKEMTIHHPTVFIKKSTYDRLGLFNISYYYAMDYELLLRFYKNGVSFYYIPQIIANMSFEGASDKHWRKAILESMNAKIETGASRMNSYWYCYKQFIRTYFARTLKKWGMEDLLKFYRKHFSLIKKY